MEQICAIIAPFVRNGTMHERGEKMYLKDKKQRLTLRLNEEQFEFVRKSSEMLGVSPSDFLRMVVNLSMATSQKAERVIDKVEEGMRRENEQADKHDIV